jgi:hypothetical protein
LAANGYSSLALTPSHVEMIGQNPPLEQQGLKIASAPMEDFRGDHVFKFYRDRLSQVRMGERSVVYSGLIHSDSMGGPTIFAHQISAVGGWYDGTWTLKDAIGFGPFGWRAAAIDTQVTLPVLGPCALLVSGGEHGGECEVEDKESKFIARPKLPPETSKGVVIPITIPANISYREITIKPMTTGITFYGFRPRDAQPLLADFYFSYSVLPPP